jgi:hypothetical protein
MVLGDPDREELPSTTAWAVHDTRQQNRLVPWQNVTWRNLVADTSGDVGARPTKIAFSARKLGSG